MTTPTKLVINCATGERKEIPLSAEEIAERETMALEAEIQRLADESTAQALEDLKTSARAKLVSGTPLTVEEAATLVL